MASRHWLAIGPAYLQKATKLHLYSVYHHHYHLYVLNTSYWMHYDVPVFLGYKAVVLDGGMDIVNVWRRVIVSLDWQVMTVPGRLDRIPDAIVVGQSRATTSLPSAAIKAGSPPSLPPTTLELNTNSNSLN